MVYNCHSLTSCLLRHFHPYYAYCALSASLLKYIFRTTSTSTSTSTMDHSRLLAAGLLVNLAVVGIHFIVSGPIHNGYAALLSSWASSFPTLLPNSTPDDRVYFRRVYTRLFPFVGDVISRLTPVFWPLITVQKPELTLFGIYVFGQLWASETLLILEGWGVGNMGRLVS